MFEEEEVVNRYTSEWVKENECVGPSVNETPHRHQHTYSENENE